MASSEPGGGVIQMVIFMIIGVAVWIAQAAAKKKKDAEAAALAALSRVDVAIQGARGNVTAPEVPFAIPVEPPAPAFETQVVGEPEVVLQATRDVGATGLVPLTPAEYRDAVIWREVFAPCPGMRT